MYDYKLIASTRGRAKLRLVCFRHNDKLLCAPQYILTYVDGSTILVTYLPFQGAHGA